MFDAQSLLGGLLKSTMGSNNMGTKSAMGMGAIGVAIAAYEHFTKDANKNQSNNKTTAPSSAPPPPMHNTAPSSTPSAMAPPVPPPVSSAPSSAPPPMTPANKTDQQAQDQDSLLLIDAMIAAANADGDIDPDEETKILKQLTEINSDQEGFDYVQQRIDKPHSLEQINQRVNNAEIAKQVYMVSLLAITVDTKEEETYLANLAEGLSLSATDIEQLHEQFLVKE